MLKRILNLRIFWSTSLIDEDPPNSDPYTIRVWENIFLDEYHTIRRPVANKNDSFRTIQKWRKEKWRKVIGWNQKK